MAEIFGLSFQVFLYNLFFPFVLLFILVYLMLEKTKVLTENKKINTLVSFFLSFLFVFSLFYLNLSSIVSNFAIIIFLASFLGFFYFYSRGTATSYSRVLSFMNVMGWKIVKKSDYEDLSRGAAEILSTEIARNLNNGVAVFLSGGSTLARLYELLPEYLSRSTNDFSKLHLLVGDDKIDGSNARMIEGTLIAKFRQIQNITQPNFYKIPVEEGERAASNYEKTVEEILGKTNYHVVLLDIEKDGHVASIFPKSKIFLEGSNRLVEFVKKEEIDTEHRIDRITITYNVINRANIVLILASGEEKSEILRNLFENPGLYPAGKIKGNVFLIADTNALKEVRR